MDTRDGISLTFKLVANPVIRGIVFKGADELPVVLIHEVFKPQFGKVGPARHCSPRLWMPRNSRNDGSKCV